MKRFLIQNVHNLFVLMVITKSHQLYLWGSLSYDYAFFKIEIKIISNEILR